MAVSYIKHFQNGRTQVQTDLIFTLTVGPTTALLWKLTQLAVAHFGEVGCSTNITTDWCCMRKSHNRLTVPIQSDQPEGFFEYPDKNVKTLTNK